MQTVRKPQGVECAGAVERAAARVAAARVAGARERARGTSVPVGRSSAWDVTQRECEVGDDGAEERRPCERELLEGRHAHAHHDRHEGEPHARRDGLANATDNTRRRLTHTGGLRRQEDLPSRDLRALSPRDLGAVWAGAAHLTKHEGGEGARVHGAGGLDDLCKRDRAGGRAHRAGDVPDRLQARGCQRAAKRPVESREGRRWAERCKSWQRANGGTVR